MAYSRAFCPAHITGFFRVCNEERDPLKIGSLGAGVCLNRGIITTVEAKPAKENEIKIFVNMKVDNVKVTKDTAEKMLKIANEKYSEKYSLTIRQEMQIPVYAGFGASGAAAFSTALAINEALKLGLTKNKVGQIAHLIEVENLTGLGDVISQSVGGVEIRVKEGAPGYGVVDTIPVPENYVVVCGSEGVLKTKNVLSDKEKRARINLSGEQLINEILRDAHIEKMMKLSREFMHKVKLASEKVKKTLLKLEKEGFKDCSMIMLGESVFCITPSNKAKKAYKIIKSCMPRGFIKICKIDFKGARLL